MTNSEYIESEKPALELFQKMGYQYLKGTEITERSDISEVVLPERLRSAIVKLNPKLDTSNHEKAFSQITSLVGSSLMEINQKVWDLFRDKFTLKQQNPDGTEDFYPVKYIDFEYPENNEFLVVNQLKFSGKIQNSIPDIMLYVNGLPLGVIECKSPKSNAWEEAYNDLKYYQENSEKLFYYNQICCGIWRDNGKYGAISSPAQFYSFYRTEKDEDLSFLGEDFTEQDKLLYSIFRKERFLDIINYFVLFEISDNRTIKKLPRYQQLRATNKAVQRLQNKKGGVVWHTQGSGKSLTMAYLTRKLRAEKYGFENPTILVLTDRTELDKQISETFQNVGLPVSRASSVIHLEKLLRNDYGGIITSTLHKFQEPRTEEESKAPDQTQLEETTNQKIEKEITDGILTKTTKKLIDGKWEITDTQKIELTELSDKENIYVLVDEAHRSHYGFLASFMQNMLPKAKFIAFTGTPISKQDKSTLQTFDSSEYIDIYTIKESVKDGATVELFYEAGLADLQVHEDNLNRDFKEEFGDKSAEKQEALKRDALKKYQRAESRIRKISEHLIEHFRDKIYANDHKAMLVCDGRSLAVLYQKMMVKLREEGFHDFETKAVMSLGSPKNDKIAKEFYKAVDWNKTHEDKKPIWVVAPEEISTVSDDFKLPFGNENETEKSGKKKHDNTAIIIVSDMLLTGWDAPIASCLYMDKSLKEHNLLQAIARVNRSKSGKNAGFIMDYYGISENLTEALEIFSGDLEREDIMKDLNVEIPYLEGHHTSLVQFFDTLGVDRKTDRPKFMDKAIQFLEPEDIRDKFKDLFKAFGDSLAKVLPNKEATKYYDDFKLFKELKLRLRSAFQDDKDLKTTTEEHEILQKLINDHLVTEGIEDLLESPVSIIDKEEFEASLAGTSEETRELKIRNNLKHTIQVGMDKNPDFYKPLAQRLEELLKSKAENRLAQLELLQDKIINHQQESENLGFDTEQEKAVYTSMKVIFEAEAVDATHTLFDLIEGELKMVEWWNKNQVINEMETKIKRFLKMKLGHSEAKLKSKEIIKTLIKNQNA